MIKEEVYNGLGLFYFIDFFKALCDISVNIIQNKSVSQSLQSVLHTHFLLKKIFVQKQLRLALKIFFIVLAN